MDKNGWRLFIQWCLASDEKMLIELLTLLLTQEEKENIATRCLIVTELLKAKKTQRDIAADLNVSITKITRGSNELKRMPDTLITFLKKNLL